jgi:tetratricopeptide (TPR) repeat protein
LERALTIAENLDDKRALGLALSGIRSYTYVRAQWKENLDYSLYALRLHQETGHLNGQEQELNVLGCHYFYQGSFDQALRYNQQHLKLADETEIQTFRSNALGTLGGILRRKGQINEAAKALKEGLELSILVNEAYNIIPNGGELGRCYLRLGKLDLALETLHQVKNVYDKTKVGFGAQTPLINGLAEAYLLAAENGDPTDWLRKAKNACDAAVKAGEASRPSLPEAYHFKGTYNWLAGKKRTAVKLWEKSIALAEEQGQLHDLGCAHFEMGKRLGDRSHLERAEAIFAEIGAEWDLARTRAALALLKADV